MSSTTILELYTRGKLYKKTKTRFIPSTVKGEDAKTLAVTLDIAEYVMIGCIWARMMLKDYFFDGDQARFLYFRSPFLVLTTNPCLPPHLFNTGLQS